MLVRLEQYAEARSLCELWLSTMAGEDPDGTYYTRMTELYLFHVLLPLEDIIGAREFLRFNEVLSVHQVQVHSSRLYGSMLMAV